MTLHFKAKGSHGRSVIHVSLCVYAFMGGAYIYTCLGQENATLKSRSIWRGNESADMLRRACIYLTILTSMIYIYLYM
jgi:hypothetical protein